MKAFKPFIKLFEAPQRSVKIKIEVNFLSSSWVTTGRFNLMFSLVEFKSALPFEV